ncbi:hypothetical protein, partial [Pseudomonas protegens]|uniref:hypothetical protein n=1 Tax=Pseudomonas protegens TaxID=380021 RepID=UPI001C83EC6E
KAKVVNAVERLSRGGRSSALQQTKLLLGTKDLFSLRVGAELRVLVRFEGENLKIEDVVRRSQLDGLRRVERLAQAHSV